MCDAMKPITSSITEQFPLSLRYETDRISLGIDTDTEYFKGYFQISNAEKIFLKTTPDGFESDQETEFIEMPKQKSMNMNIHAKRLWWDSPASLYEFDSVKDKVPQDLLPARPSCQGEPESEWCDSEWEEYNSTPWVNANPQITYGVGVCGENLSYVSRYSAASVDDLYSFGISVAPNGPDLTGYVLSFAGVSHLELGGKTITPTDRVELIVFFDGSNNDNNSIADPASRSSISMVATQISDGLILGRDPSTRAVPGLVYVYDANTEEEQAFYSTGLEPIQVLFNGNP